jgi:hypothetical protein
MKIRISRNQKNNTLKIKDVLKKFLVRKKKSIKQANLKIEDKSDDIGDWNWHPDTHS